MKKSTFSGTKLILQKPYANFMAVGLQIILIVVWYKKIKHLYLHAQFSTTHYKFVQNVRNC